MKLSILALFALAFLYQSPAHAGGAYTCKASNSSTAGTLYIELGFKKIFGAPNYEKAVFLHATPAQIIGGAKATEVYYMAAPEGERAFQVIAVLETSAIVNDRFTGRLTVTDGRAKPYASLFELACSK